MSDECRSCEHGNVFGGCEIEGVCVKTPIVGASQVEAAPPPTDRHIVKIRKKEVVLPLESPTERKPQKEIMTTAEMAKMYRLKPKQRHKARRAKYNGEDPASRSQQS